jgi:glycosyltransferase involved in cell wall biosynthesis
VKISVISDPHIPIPPEQYGGTERIVHVICAGMEARGHVVNLIAGKGSNSYSGKLYIHQSPSRAYRSRVFRKIWFQILSIPQIWDSDIVINFGRVDYLELLLRTSKPLICRFANPILQSEVDFLNDRRKSGKNLMLIGISQSQVKQLKTPLDLTVVHNGVELNKFDFIDKVEQPPYLVFLGRLTQNKGVDIAISIAQQAGIHLKIAGNVSTVPDDIYFFESKVKPQLGKGCEWIGPVNDIQKNELLGNALALLFPIQWDEPFGIVMAESLACGTPIIATRRGSTPEVVEHGRTGFLCESLKEMVEAVCQIQRINRQDCRYAAEMRFSAEVMVDQYMCIISQMLSKS